VGFIEGDPATDRLFGWLIYCFAAGLAGSLRWLHPAK
jgi:hypothetical protein